jgi:hypothetical protein
MRYVRTVAPEETPITLDEAKAACSIAVENTDLDDWINSLIAEATDAIEKRLSRQINDATWTLSLDSFPSVAPDDPFDVRTGALAYWGIAGEIVLERPPVTGVVSIEYIGQDGITRTLPEDQYQVDLGGPNNPARIRPTYGLVWPYVKLGTYNAVVVTFTAGATMVSDVSPCIKRAVKFLVAHWFRNHEPVGQGNALPVPATFDFALLAEDWGAYT